jgi:hypothetical protein
VQGHGPGYGRVDQVILVEDRLEHDTQELGQAGLLEVERDAVAGGVTARLPGPSALHEDPGAAFDGIATRRRRRFLGSIGR